MFMNTMKCLLLLAECRLLVAAGVCGEVLVYRGGQRDLSKVTLRLSSRSRAIVGTGFLASRARKRGQMIPIRPQQQLLCWPVWCMHKACPLLYSFVGGNTFTPRRGVLLHLKSKDFELSTGTCDVYEDNGPCIDRCRKVSVCLSLWLHMQPMSQ